MSVLKTEWRRYRRYIIIWSLALAGCIFLLTPVYVRMVQDASSLPARFGEGGFLTTLGVSLELLQTPIGMYGFLTDFLMLAGGIYGLHLGLILFTRECIEGTAEYLFTRPISRGEIFLSKALCLLLGMVVMGALYIFASFATMTLFHLGYLPGELFLLALSLPLHSLLYGAFGLLAGIIWQKNRAPLLGAGLAVLIGYGLTAFARTVENRPLSYLSVFSFFEPSAIHELGHYEGSYFCWYLILLAVSLSCAYRILDKIDIQSMG